MFNVSIVGRGCYRNRAQKGTFSSSYLGDILMEFRHGASISLTNAPKWCFFPALKMKSTFVQTLKHTPADGRMSIWQRNCFGFGIVGIKT